MFSTLAAMVTILETDPETDESFVRTAAFLGKGNSFGVNFPSVCGDWCCLVVTHSLFSKRVTSFHRKSKTGVSVAPQKGLMSFKFFLKKNTHVGSRGVEPPLH